MFLRSEIRREPGFKVVIFDENRLDFHDSDRVERCSHRVSEIRFETTRGSGYPVPARFQRHASGQIIP